MCSSSVQPVPVSISAAHTGELLVCSCDVQLFSAACTGEYQCSLCRWVSVQPVPVRGYCAAVMCSSSVHMTEPEPLYLLPNMCRNATVLHGKIYILMSPKCQIMSQQQEATYYSYASNTRKIGRIQWTDTKIAKPILLTQKTLLTDLTPTCNCRTRENFTNK